MLVGEGSAGNTTRPTPSERRRVRVIALVAFALAVGAMVRPFVNRQLNFETGAGPAYRMTEDGTLEFWRITWDRIYLEWIMIGAAAWAVVTFARRRRPGRLNRRQTAVLSVAVSGFLLTCLFPYVSYTDSSDMAKPGEGRSYQTPDGIWMSYDPILPRFLQGHRFIGSEYTGVIWDRMGMYWGAIIVLAGLSLLLLRGGTSTAAWPEVRPKHELSVR